MKKFSKIVGSMAAGALAIASLSANAVTYSLGGVAAADGSGLTSAFVPTNNIANPLSGYFVETFDLATRNPTLNALGFTGLQTSVNLPGTQITLTGPGASFNSYGAVSVTTTGGGLEIRTGNGDGKGAPPAGDTTNFAFGPSSSSSGTAATAKIDYSNFLSFLPTLFGTTGATYKISYLGLYYGSIDNYNNIGIYGSDGNAISGSGILADGILKGAEILGQTGGTTGNQSQAGSNVYVNYFFNPSEYFSAFEFQTTGRAFELDNVVVGVTQIPEPASLALIGLGLFGLGAMRRRKMAQ